ncbi:MAG: glycosyltransferase family 4 protein [Pseudoxanthomonas sp.]
MRENSVRPPVALLVTRNFPPLLGGMEKVNAHLLEALLPTYAIALCGPAGCNGFVPAGTIVSESQIKPLPVFLIMTLWRTLQLALQYRPQWLLAGSGLTAPMTWLAARCVGAKVGVYLHGLDLVAPSRIYQWLWLPFIRRCDIALVNSSHTAQLGAVRGVDSQRIHVLHPGTDLPIPDVAAAQVLRERYDFSQRPLLLSVGRLTRRKGLAEFVENALPAILARQPEALLVVIGDEAVDALHGGSGSERERILAAARRKGVESSLRFLGRCDELTLGAAYQAADVHVFPVLELQGDVEGFGMVALESAAHGLPTVAFAVGGVSDAVRNGVTGTLVKPGDYIALSEAVIQRLSRIDVQTEVDACRTFAAGKTWAVFGERLRQLLESARG